MNTHQIKELRIMYNDSTWRLIFEALATRKNNIKELQLGILENEVDLDGAQVPDYARRRLFLDFFRKLENIQIGELYVGRRGKPTRFLWSEPLTEMVAAARAKVVEPGVTKPVIENNPTNVVAAFDILMEEVETEIEFVNRVGAKAFEECNYERCHEALDRASHVSSFRGKVAALRQDWDLLVATEPVEADDELSVHAERRNLGRLKRGLRTPQEKYCEPILKAVVQLGGSANMSEVLQLVEQHMKDTLREVDYEPLASYPDLPRWRNAAQWTRNTLVQGGYLKADSPRGTWEISEMGQKALEDGKFRSEKSSQQ